MLGTKRWDVKKTRYVDWYSNISECLSVFKCTLAVLLLFDSFLPFL